MLLSGYCQKLPTEGGREGKASLFIVSETIEGFAFHYRSKFKRYWTDCSVRYFFLKEMYGLFVFDENNFEGG